MKILGRGGRGQPSLGFCCISLGFFCIELVLSLSLSLSSSSSISVSLSALILATDDELTIQFENSGKKSLFCTQHSFSIMKILFILCLLPALAMTLKDWASNFFSILAVSSHPRTPTFSPGTAGSVQLRHGLPILHTMYQT